MKNEPKQSFKQATPLQKRQKIVSDALKKSPNSHILIIERHPKHAQTLPDLLHSRFIVNKSQTVLQLLEAVKQRLAILDEKCKIEMVNFYIGNKMVDKGKRVEEVYEANKDGEDGILYVWYSNVDCF